MNTYLEERHNLIVDLGLFAEQEESTDDGER
jgi:hypothetical protein